MQFREGLGDWQQGEIKTFLMSTKGTWISPNETIDSDSDEFGKPTKVTEPSRTAMDRLKPRTKRGSYR